MYGEITRCCWEDLITTLVLLDARAPGSQVVGLRDNTVFSLLLRFLSCLFFLWLFILSIIINTVDSTVSNKK